MPEPPRKMSEILKEMSERLLRDRGHVPSRAAAEVALFLASVAWNECVGLDHPRGGHRHVWESIEADDPALWDEFKSGDINGLIDELVRYKRAHYPDDRRRILICGIIDGKVHGEWMNAVAPGVDPKWEMRLYGLVRMGNQDGAIRFPQETRRMSRKEAMRTLAAVVTEQVLQAG